MEKISTDQICITFRTFTLLFLLNVIFVVEKGHFQRSHGSDRKRSGMMLVREEASASTRLFNVVPFGTPFGADT